MRRAAAAAGAAAAAVEDRQLDAVLARRRRRAPPARGRSPTAPRGSRRPCPSRSSRPSPRRAAALADPARSARRRAARRGSRGARARSSTVSNSGTTASGSPVSVERAQRRRRPSDVPETISVSSAARRAAPRRLGGRDRLARALALELARVQPHVELRDVEAEDLDLPLERGDAAVGDAAAAVRLEARADHARGRRAAPSATRSASLPSRHHMNESLRRYGSSSLRAPISAA